MDSDDFKKLLQDELSPHFDWVKAQTAPGYGVFVNVLIKNKAGTGKFFFLMMFGT